MNNLDVDKILDEAPDGAESYYDCGYYGGLYYKTMNGVSYFWLVGDEWMESTSGASELAYSLVELKKQHNSILL